MKNQLMTGELQGIWMHGHAESRPPIARVVLWMRRAGSEGWRGQPGRRLRPSRRRA